MSRTTLYATKRSGKLYAVAEFHNSWLSAMHVWTTLAKRYEVYKEDIEKLREESDFYRRDDDLAFHSAMSADQSKKIWPLYKDARISDVDYYVLLATYDRAVLPNRTALVVAQALREFDPGTESLRGQADVIEKMAKSGTQFFAWQQTSVAEDMWVIYGPHGGARPYDLNRDTKHFFIEKREVVQSQNASPADG